MSEGHRPFGADCRVVRSVQTVVSSALLSGDIKTKKCTL